MGHLLILHICGSDSQLPHRVLSPHVVESFSLIHRYLFPYNYTIFWQRSFQMPRCCVLHCFGPNFFPPAFRQCFTKTERFPRVSRCLNYTEQKRPRAPNFSNALMASVKNNESTQICYCASDTVLNTVKTGNALKQLLEGKTTILRSKQTYTCCNSNVLPHKALAFQTNLLDAYVCLAVARRKQLLLSNVCRGSLEYTWAGGMLPPTHTHKHCISHLASATWLWS